MSEAKYKIEEGLIVGPNAGECAGYIFDFGNGRGAFDPTGKITVGNLELTRAQVDAHNKILSDAEIKSMIEKGKGLFYLSYETPKCTPEKPRWKLENNREWYERNFSVSNWADHFRVKAYASKFYAVGFGGRMQAFNVWFTGPDGKKWYGVQKSNGQNFIARRLKNQK